MPPATTSPLPPEELIGFMQVDETDFASFTRAQQIRHLEVEGYVVLPRIIPADFIVRIKQEMSEAGMGHTSYSTAQTRAVEQPQWTSRAVCKLIGFPPMIDFLTDLMGPDIVFTRGFFQRTWPGCPGISMHTDGQPHGSNLFGYEGSCPRLLRVLYYLDDLTPQRAPFRVIPLASVVSRGGQSLCALQIASGRNHAGRPGRVGGGDPIAVVSRQPSESRHAAERTRAVGLPPGMGRTDSAGRRVGSHAGCRRAGDRQTVSEKPEHDWFCL